MDIHPSKIKPIYNTVTRIIKCSMYFMSFIRITKQSSFDYSQNLQAYQRTVASSMSINSPSITVQTNTSANPTETVPPPPAAPAAANNNNNELEPENDLLGILNMIVELFVLCSIIYFYSTFSRFLLVFLFFVLLFL